MEYCTNEFRYDLKTDGTAAILKYLEDAPALQIPKEIDGHPVTAIGGRGYCRSRITDLFDFDSVFDRCKNLASVTIPDWITKIGDRAFYGCKSLVAVTLPHGINVIDDYTFSGCEQLLAIAIPDSVEKICKGAFQNCHSLTVAAIPSGVTAIEDYAFAGCFSLMAVSIPDTVKEIGEYAFEGCHGLNITIPASVTKIGEKAFARNDRIYAASPSVVKAYESTKDKNISLKVFPGSCGEWYAKSNNIPYTYVDEADYPG